MADSKITGLSSIGTGADPNNDQLVIVDVSDNTMASTGTTKRATLNGLLSTRASIYTGVVDPEGVVTAVAGSIYFNIAIASSPVQFIKGSGTGNTGWI
jgi:hypothetical protein